MHEYYLLDPHSHLPGLVLQEDMVLRQVYKVGDTAQDNPAKPRGPRSGAPNAGTKVWQNFTKIYNRDDKLMYAVCHDCDKILCAQTKKDGTKSLSRHSETCSCEPNSN
ncbi:unnamed protein product [Urochloa humidicola]